MYADAEQVVVAYVAALPGFTAAVETGNDLATKLPFARVTRLGGTDNYITDSAVVDIDVFGATRADASASAQTVHAAMHRLRHTAVNGVLIDNVETISGPLWVNWDDENLQRYVLSYQIESRIVAQPS